MYLGHVHEMKIIKKCLISKVLPIVIINLGFLKSTWPKEVMQLWL